MDSLCISFVDRLFLNIICLYLHLFRHVQDREPETRLPTYLARMHVRRRRASPKSLTRTIASIFSLFFLCVFVSKTGFHVSGCRPLSGRFLPWSQGGGDLDRPQLSKHSGKYMDELEKGLHPTRFVHLSPSILRVSAYMRAWRSHAVRAPPCGEMVFCWRWMST